MEVNLDYSGNKGFRMLHIYERLNKGDVLVKSQLAQEYHVSPKTIQRDLDDLRIYLLETHCFENETAIQYSKHKNGYYLVRQEREWFTREEVLVLSKIVLESRAFCKEEMKLLMDKLLLQVLPKERKIIEEIIKNEYINYVPLKHGQKLISLVWELQQFTLHQEIITFTYTRQDQRVKKHKVRPAAVMFAEFYFYLVAYGEKETINYPIIFRVDRINELQGTAEKFKMPYTSQFNDGEFRKRIQFMYPGKLQVVKFKYYGKSIESVLDRLPTAKIIEKQEQYYVIEAEVYGKGIDMWLRSQGDMVCQIET